MRKHERCRCDSIINTPKVKLAFLNDLSVSIDEGLQYVVEERLRHNAEEDGEGVVARSVEAKGLLLIQPVQDRLRQEWNKKLFTLKFYELKWCY